MESTTKLQGMRGLEKMKSIGLIICLFVLSSCTYPFTCHGVYVCGSERGARTDHKRVSNTTSTSTNHTEIAPVQQQQSSVLIPGVGYAPSPNSLVYNCDTSSENLTIRCGGKTTPLNVSVPWSGSNGDVTGYVGRYLGGKVSCAASWICGVGNENECLNSSKVLREMFQRGELGDRNLYTGEPTRTECHDYGSQHPELGSVGGSNNGLRKQPNAPPGCCKVSNPCQIDEPGRLVGEKWSEAVLTPQGGRKGCYFEQVRRDKPDKPDKPEDPIDPITPPVDPIPNPPIERCYKVKVSNNILSVLSEIGCQ